MADHNGMEAILKQLNASIAALENGTLNLEGLDQLVSDSRELHERALILRYKAYETQVFGSQPTSVKEVVVVMEEPVVEEPETALFEAPEAEPEAEITPEPIEEEEEVPAFDFSLFDDNIEAVKEEEAVEDTIEHVSVTNTTVEDHGIQEERVIMEQVTVHPTSAENTQFIRRFSTTDPSLAAQLSMSRLDTLIGSFGLNERLHFINELFDGSSEAFSEAVKSLDSLASAEEALVRASAFANQYNWDLDNEIVEEFVLKLKRRYA